MKELCGMAKGRTRMGPRFAARERENTFRRPRLARDNATYLSEDDQPGQTELAIADGFASLDFQIMAADIPKRRGTGAYTVDLECLVSHTASNCVSEWKGQWDAIEEHRGMACAE